MVKGVLFTCLLALGVPSMVSAAEPISEKWLSNQVATIPAEKGTKYSLYVKPLTENVKDEPHVMYDMSSLSVAIYDKIGR